MELEYIKLLIDGCLKLKNKPLFISYNKINEDFVKKVVKYVKDKGVDDIYLDENDSFYIHDYLKDATIKEIENNKLFDSSVWDEYAKKEAAFLMLTSEIPELMNDIDSEKVSLVSKRKLETKPIYREMQMSDKLAWCIAAVPNTYWANYIYKDSRKPIDDFWKDLKNICMLNDDPIKEWKKFLKKQSEIKNKLDNLEITKLYYKNSLGTDLELSLPKDVVWQTAYETGTIVNMPSYEVFTCPDYRKTKGIVYSSKPLIYSGKVVDEFYLKFKNGKVIEYGAKKGEDILKELIESDKNMQFLGEAALVNYDSPISNTKRVFYTTLIDENASCHLALGEGFSDCIKDGVNKDSKELLKLGVNKCSNHVDFMIGTEDLIIEAETSKGRITIMEKGNLVI